MEEIKFIPKNLCKNIKGIFFDIDDTITTNGKLLKSSFNAIWKAYDAGLKMVPVTGRPAGWVDHIARMWPVSGVVGENGAFYFWMEKNKMQRFFIQDKETREKNRKQLEKIKKEILKEVPNANISADQKYRECDLAIDFCEDIPALDKDSINKIVEIFAKYNAISKISSIHVNGWFGEFDKMTTCKIVIEKIWNEKNTLSNYIYCGDSPNDEEIFKGFKTSVGVANIKKWLDYIQHKPNYVTNEEGGEGFSEFINIILNNR